MIPMGIIGVWAISVILYMYRLAAGIWAALYDSRRHLHRGVRYISFNKKSSSSYSVLSFTGKCHFGNRLLIGYVPIQARLH
jgi:hypothetical protein